MDQHARLPAASMQRHLLEGAFEKIYFHLLHAQSPFQLCDALL
jgi:hypothetical protein